MLISVLIILSVISLSYYSAQSTSVQSHNELKAQNSNTVQTISPGSEPFFSCPVIANAPVPISIISTSGITHYNVNGVADYVLSAGSTGTITYGFSSGVSQGNNGTVTVYTLNSSSPSSLNLNASFYHSVQVSGTYSVTNLTNQSVNQTAVNQSSTNQSTNQSINSNVTNQSTNQSAVNESTAQYQVCYNITNVGRTCTYNNTAPTAGSVTLNEVSDTHPGLTVGYNTISTGIKTGPSRSMVLSSDQNTPQGTYWMTVGGGPCFGGKTVLLTVGNGPYSGSVASQNTYP